MSALSGIKVLELAEGVAGEYCGKLLADFGAEIIKLEKPGWGSPTRRLGPFAPRGAEPERSGLFAYLNTGKRSVALDPSAPANTVMLARLLERVDVVIDDHPAGWLDGLGLGLDAVEHNRPRLVLCSITAFGQSPSEDRLHAEDLTVFHASGWGYHTPSGAADETPPLKGPGRFLPSYEAGLDAALCIAAALYERATSGLGRCIDVSKQAVLASRVDYVLGQMVAGDMEPNTKRKAFDLFGPAGIFPCRDGYVYIWMSTPGHWDGLGELLGQPEWMQAFPERWLERAATAERVTEVRSRLADWLKTQDKDEVAARAQNLGLTMVAVNSVRDLQSSPQYAFRRFFTEVNHPAQGPALYPTVPYRLSVTPAAIQSPAPLLGANDGLLEQERV
jgi:crotonobetainyl-CoA:carnitine CoA-transferase CaiB-like acyl-CoA transferase